MVFLDGEYLGAGGFFRSTVKHIAISFEAIDYPAWKLRIIIF